MGRVSPGPQCTKQKVLVCFHVTTLHPKQERISSVCDREERLVRITLRKYGMKKKEILVSRLTNGIKWSLSLKK